VVAYEVNKAIANITLILYITRKIKEIVSIRHNLIYFLSQLFYCIFI